MHGNLQVRALASLLVSSGAGNGDQRLALLGELQPVIVQVESVQIARFAAHQQGDARLADLIAARVDREVFDLRIQIVSELLASLTGHQIQVQGHIACRRDLPKERFPVRQIQVGHRQVEGRIAEGVRHVAPGQIHGAGQLSAQQRIAFLGGPHR